MRLSKTENLLLLTISIIYIMKKILISLLALMAILPASADRYLTFGNDTVRIKPSCLGGVQGFMLRGHFDGRLDKWDMTLQIPQGLSLLYASRKNDMLYIPYDSIYGNPTYCSAQLFYVENYYTQRDSLSSSIIVPGYWDSNNDNIYETYGSVKWEAGDYAHMCELFYSISDNFPDTASIVINEHLSSTFDMRGFTIPQTDLKKRIHLYVGYLLGDVDGNEVVNLDDCTMLIDYVLNGGDLDRYQLKAADVDGDGNVSITDVTALSDLILNG